jgi:hypothetical protein
MSITRGNNVKREYTAAYYTTHTTLHYNTIQYSIKYGTATCLALSLTMFGIKLNSPYLYSRDGMGHGQCVRMQGDVSAPEALRRPVLDIAYYWMPCIGFTSGTV